MSFNSLNNKEKHIEHEVELEKYSNPEKNDLITPTRRLVECILLKSNRISLSRYRILIIRIWFIKILIIFTRYSL